MSMLLYLVMASDEESGNDSHVRKVIVDSLHWLFEAHDTKV